MVLQETYELTDYYYYDSQTTDKGRYSVTTGTANLSYSNNGFKCIGTASVDTFVKNTALTLPTNYEAEFTVTEKFGSHYGGICLDDLLINFGGSDMTFYRLSTITKIGTTYSVLNTGDVFKVVMQSNTVKVYRNGSLLQTFNNISNTGVYQHRIYVDRGQTVKDLKVKAL